MRPEMIEVVDRENVRGKSQWYVRTCEGKWHYALPPPGELVSVGKRVNRGMRRELDRYVELFERGQ